MSESLAYYFPAVLFGTTFLVVVFLAVSGGGGGLAQHAHISHVGHAQVQSQEGIQFAIQQHKSGRVQQPEVSLPQKKHCSTASVIML